MSLSRAIALSDDKTREEIFAALANEALNRGITSRDGFDAWVRPHYRALYRGGWSKEQLKELRNRARQVFKNLRDSRKATTPEPEPQAAPLTSLFELLR